MTWQPIETAPMDGTEILCHSAVSDGEEFHSSVWVDAFWNGDWLHYPRRIDIFYRPTHWMPLPAPPQVGLIAVIVDRLERHGLMGQPALAQRLWRRLVNAFRALSAKAPATPTTSAQSGQ